MSQTAAPTTAPVQAACPECDAPVAVSPAP